MENGYDNMEELDDLMSKLEDAQRMSQEKQAQIEALETTMRDEIRPVVVEEMKARIEELKADKTEFDEMSATAALQARARLEAVRKASEDKFAENLIQSSTSRQSSNNQEKRYAADEEAVKAELQEKVDKLKQRAIEKAMANGKTPDEVKAIKDAEFAKIEAYAQKYLDKLENRTLTTEREADYQALLSSQADIRNKLKGYEQFLSMEFPEVMKAPAEVLETALPPLEQYDKAKSLLGELSEQKAIRLKRIDEINAELAKGENKELSEEKEKIEAEIKRIEEEEKKCQEKMDTIKEQMDEEQLEELKAQEQKEQEAAGRGKGGHDDDSDRDVGSGSGSTGLIPVVSEAYYESKNIFGKQKLKIKAYEHENDDKPARFFTKLRLFFPSKSMREAAIKYMSEGSMKPLEGDEEVVAKIQDKVKQEMEERAKAEKEAAERDPNDDAYKAPEARGRDDEHDPFPKAEVDEKAAREASKGETSEPEKDEDEMSK